MKILITGGGGYLGCVLISALARGGHQMTVFDSFLHGDRAVTQFAADGRVCVVEGDVRDRDALAKVISGHRWVVHLAAVVGYPACMEAPERARATNVDGTRNLLSVMDRDQRLILASTVSVYGRVDGIATEKTIPGPLSLYGETKLEAENRVRESGVPAIVLRLATLFGPSPRMRW